ncbi:MAG: dTDP-4-dehydrorhamnose reductase [Saprospiraceae bacterium]|nr:dTDP-4-dehydrorhamnose reductase [Saprospiraceae bacterium]
MAHPRILVTGARGQLGLSFRHLAGQFPDWHFHYVDIDELDITNRKAVFSFFNTQQPDWCINCAAYALVDKAESEPALARRVNVAGVKNLAEACAGAGIPLVHFSTDYVYHGQRNLPYREEDPVSPKSVYARTKLAGDRAALRGNPLSMVIRTSWLYSPWGNNFLLTMLRLGAQRPELRVVFDQCGTPTYAPDLALAVLHIVQQVEQKSIERHRIGGIWHYSNEGVASWYDFAQAIFDLRNMPCRVWPIESKDFPTPVARPPFSVLNKAKIKAAFGLDIPYWRDGLERCLAELG